MRHPVIKLLLAVAMILAPGTAEGQGTTSSFSVWFGSATDRFEEELPFALQVGGRFEVSPIPYVWIGGELMTRFLNEGYSCAGIGCESGTSLSAFPLLATHLRIEVGDLAVKPYIFGTYGWSFHGGRSTVRGGGAGIRIPDVVLADGVSVEVRYRDDDRFTIIDHDYWEVLFGIQL